MRISLASDGSRGCCSARRCSRCSSSPCTCSRCCTTARFTPGSPYLPVAVTIFLAAGVGGQLVMRFGFKPILTAGMALLAGGLYWFSHIAAHGGSLDRPRHWS